MIEIYESVVMIQEGDTTAKIVKWIVDNTDMTRARVRPMDWKIDLKPGDLFLFENSPHKMIKYPATIIREKGGDNTSVEESEPPVLDTREKYQAWIHEHAKDIYGCGRVEILGDTIHKFDGVSEIDHS